MPFRATARIGEVAGVEHSGRRPGSGRSPSKNIHGDGPYHAEVGSGPNPYSGRRPVSNNIRVGGSGHSNARGRAAGGRVTRREGGNVAVGPKATSKVSAHGVRVGASGHPMREDVQQKGGSRGEQEATLLLVRGLQRRCLLTL